jgi:AraC family transcriptional regulator
MLEEHSVSLGGNTREVLMLNTVVVVQLHHPSTIEYKERSRFVAKRVLPGRVSIRPNRTAIAARSADRLDFLAFSFEPGFIEMACGEFENPERLELGIHHAVEDRLSEGICMALRQELSSGGAAGRLYSDTLASSLAVHLVARYGLKQQPVGENWRAGGPAMVRQAMEYMRDNLRQDLSLRDIATAVGLSPFHFARRFKESVGLSPYQFLLQQRMERARRLLMTGKLSIAAVAVEVGFYDQSHFAQHFKREHGLTPRQFAEQYRPRKKVAEAA